MNNGYSIMNCIVYVMVYLVYVSCYYMKSKFMIRTILYIPLSCYNYIFTNYFYLNNITSIMINEIINKHTDEKLYRKFKSYTLRFKTGSISNGRMRHLDWRGCRFESCLPEFINNITIWKNVVVVKSDEKVRQ